MWYIYTSIYTGVLVQLYQLCSYILDHFIAHLWVTLEQKWEIVFGILHLSAYWLIVYSDRFWRILSTKYGILELAAVIHLT